MSSRFPPTIENVSTTNVKKSVSAWLRSENAGQLVSELKTELLGAGERVLNVVRNVIDKPLVLAGDGRRQDAALVAVLGVRSVLIRLAVDVG